MLDTGIHKKSEFSNVINNGIAGVIIGLILAACTRFFIDTSEIGQIVFWIIPVALTSIIFLLVSYRVYKKSNDYITTRQEAINRFLLENKTSNNKDVTDELLPIVFKGLNGYDKTVANSFTISGDTYSELSFGETVYIRSGVRQKVKTVYFTCLSKGIKGNYSQIFIDSKHSTSKEFKHIYKKHQMLRLDPNVEDNFNIYVPKVSEQDYKSICNDELLHALMQNSKYDYEISGSTVYVLSDRISKMPEQFYEMQEAAKTIAEVLNKTYSSSGDDSALESSYKLQKSQTKNYLYILISIVALIIGLLLLINKTSYSAGFGLCIIGALVFYANYKDIRHN